MISSLCGAIGVADRMNIALFLKEMSRKSETSRLLRLLTAFVFVLGVFLAVWNLISTLRRLGIRTSGIHAEDADDASIRRLAFAAYRHGDLVVGFPDLRQISCDTALHKGKLVTNRQYRTGGIRQIPPARFVADSTDCFRFRVKYGYERHPPVSPEEVDFPLAFIILFHRDLHQVHLLLRAIYRPHNVYCLTPDASQDAAFIGAVRALASCLPNVFVASKLVNVTYAGFSRLQADLNCMADLMNHPVHWKYVINMPGQQFPLRTNLEMVKMIRLYNGGNDVEGLTGDSMLPKHYKQKYKVHRQLQGQSTMVATGEPHPPPPLNLKVVKGSAYNTLSRPFVRFVLRDKRVPILLNWLKEVYSPDEYFWAMLNHNHALTAPGYYPGKPDTKKSYTTFTIWQHKFPCQTILVREICILTPADFPVLLNRTELFANKFYIQHFPAALHCLDQMVFNLTLLRRTRTLPDPYDIFFALPNL